MAHRLLPLGDLPEKWQSWKADCWLSPEPFDGTAVRRFTEPFPLEEEWQWEYDYYDHDEHSPLLHGIYQNGSVLLGGNRDCEFWALVVTGLQRGRVWWLGDGCAAPYADAGRQASQRPTSWPGFRIGKPIEDGGPSTSTGRSQPTTAREGLPEGQALAQAPAAWL